jgi:negative regulator of flagellin synthesis FlgM
MVIHNNSDLTSNTSTHSRHKAGSANGPATKSDATSSPAETAVDNKPTNVQLSQQAQTIERLETKIQHSEGVDTAKVDQLKQSIADGSYEVNNERLAEKLLNHENLLG